MLNFRKFIGVCLYFNSLALWHLLSRQLHIFSCKRHGASPKLCGRHFKLIVLWKLFDNTKCRSFDSSYEIVPMKKSRTCQLYCSEAETSKEYFPWIKNIPTFSLNEKERKGKGRKRTSITKSSRELQNAAETWSKITLLGQHSGYLNYLKLRSLCQ